jgi:hypothetical protein
MVDEQGSSPGWVKSSSGSLLSLWAKRASATETWPLYSESSPANARRAAPVNRSHFQKLAKERSGDAKSLLADKRWSGAYYIAGYAIECALKACILALVEKSGMIFEDRKFAEKCWTHDLGDLMRLAALHESLSLERKPNPGLWQNWVVVKDWSEVSRYEDTHHNKAKKLYRAVSGNTSGVLPWIMSRW